MDMSSSSSSRGTSCKIKQKQKNGRPESFFLINPINKVIQWQFIHGQPSEIPTGFATGEKLVRTLFIVKMITGIFNP